MSKPPGDLGRGGRSVRRAVPVGVVVAAVGLLAAGIASLMALTGGLVGGQPTSVEGPTISQPPTLTVSAADPFPWAVAVSAASEGTWCASAVRGRTVIEDQIGQPCEQLVTPEQSGSRGGFGGEGTDMQPARSGTPTRGMSWGFAPAAADSVVVQFTDGSRRKARTTSDGAVDATLWAIAYEGVEVQGVQALSDGVVIAGFQVLSHAG